MTMPKAAINEDRDLKAADIYVRLSREIFPVKAVSDPSLAQKPTHLQLGLRIFPSYKRHSLADV